MGVVELTVRKRRICRVVVTSVRHIDGTTTVLGINDNHCKLKIIHSQIRIHIFLNLFNCRKMKK